MGQRIKMRRDTAANWTSANPILADGEIGYDKTSKRQKFGDGVTAWNDLVWVKTDYADIANAPAAFDGNYNNLTNKPALFDGNYNSLANKPNLFDGNYNSLANLPNLASYLTNASIIDGGAAAG